MYKDLDEPIDVTVLYEKGTITPFRFGWLGRAFKLVRVTGRWKAPKGDKWMRHFAIVDTCDNVWNLVYDERATQWRLNKMWVE